MKVAHFVHKWLNPSETFIYSQVKNAKRYSPIILAAQSTKHFPEAKIYSLSTAERIGLKVFGLSKTFQSAIEHEGIKIIHSHFGMAGRAIVAIKKKAAIPMITSFYGYDCYGFPEKSPNGYNELFKQGELFLALGNHMKDRLISLGCPPDKIKIHHLGVKNEKYIQRKKKSRIFFLSVARFVEKKGLEYVIKAFLEVRKNIHCELRIVGNGPLEKRLKTIAAGYPDIKFIDNFSSLEPRTIVRNEMLSADVFVLPSIRASNGDMEGTPVTLMEASSLSLPCISTLHSDIPEIIDDGKTGFLVPEKDIEKLADRMKELALDAKKRIAFGRAANRKIKREFNEKVQAGKLEKLYDSVLRVRH
ncbi:MAG: glycosyltransferase [Candidatus Aenigmarchaeota archaeon]|nr:glycosyltransferase [Candidatus Aenigmarchaeota archaeon]